jgi:hypothetical protein
MTQYCSLPRFIKQIPDDVDEKEFFGYVTSLAIVFGVNFGMIIAGMKQIGQEHFHILCNKSHIYEIAIAIFVISTIILLGIMSLFCFLQFWLKVYKHFENKNRIQTICIVVIVSTLICFFISELAVNCRDQIDKTLLYKNLIFNVVVWLIYLLYFMLKLGVILYFKI